MENNQFPEQEEEILLTEEISALPVTDAPEEDPVVDDLNSESPSPFSMEDDDEEGAFLIGEAPAAAELPDALETFSEEAMELHEETAFLPEEPVELPQPEITAAPQLLSWTGFPT